MADIENLSPIKTAHGMLEIYKDWDCEGAIYMKNPKTLNRYIELSNEQPDSDKYGIFWAFSNEQYENGKSRMKELGFYKDGQKIYSFGAGGYGTSKESIDKFFGFYNERAKKIVAECDPQEVYLYEYDNHECMLSWDGDEPAINIIVNIYGKEIADTITRF